MKFINVDVDDQDLQVRAAGRMLKQFSKAPVLLAVLWALVSEIQALSDEIIDVIRQRMPNAAKGENLNAIGRIVGQDRILVDYAEIAYFRPDTNIATVDRAPVWTFNAPLYDYGEAGDPLYRQLIQAKVSRNFAQYGSTPEIQSCIYEAFDTKVSLQKYNGIPFEATVLIQNGALSHVIGFVTKATNEVRADSVYLPPYPSTLRVRKQMMLHSSNTFRPDISTGAPDIARATTGFDFQNVTWETLHG